MTLYQRVSYITPTGAIAVAPQNSASGSLGTGLFVLPTTWAYNTYAGPGCFSTTQQGLIALMARDPVSPWGDYTDAGFRIVTKPDLTMDPLPFFQAMAAVCRYGTADEGLSQSSLTLAAKTRPLEMRCGPTTAFVMACAASVGITTREVRLLNVTGQNSFDDGHVACEAMINGAWVLVDVANDTMWSDQDGNLLSLKDVIQAGVSNCVPAALAQHRVGASPPGLNAWVAPFYEINFGSQEAVISWCERIYQVPGIKNGTGVLWGVLDGLTSYSSVIQSYTGWTAEPWSNWVRQYY